MTDTLNGKKLSDEEAEKVVGGVDDGSADNALDILDDYAKKDKRITVVHFDNKEPHYIQPTALRDDK